MRSSLAINLFSAISCVLAGDGQKPIVAPIRGHGPLPSQPKADAPSYREELLSLHKELCQTESLTGNEAGVAHWLHDYLKARNYNVQLQELPSSSSSNLRKPRFNVLAVSNSPHAPAYARVMLTSHIDTVPPYIPYKYRHNDTDEADSLITGRGTVDAKASVAAQIIAHDILANSGAIEKGSVILAFVVGEEVDGSGMEFLSDELQRVDAHFDAVIFGEPTEGKLACGHKGHLGCAVNAQGKAGHSGYPWLGKSATEVLMRALVKVLDTDLGSTELFGNTTVNVGEIKGGVASNVIAKEASAQLAIRVATGPQDTGHERVKKELERVLNEVDEEALSLDCWGSGYGALECNCDVDGFEEITVNYGTDVPHLEGNHTRYLYGPGDILVAHSDDEALTVRNLEEAVEGYKKLIKHALKHGK